MDTYDRAKAETLTRIVLDLVDAGITDEGVLIRRMTLREDFPKGTSVRLCKSTIAYVMAGGR